MPQGLIRFTKRAARRPIPDGRRRASDPRLPVVAVLDDGAAFAQRIAWAAELAPVADEVDVERVELPGGHEPVHEFVGAHVGALLGEKADAAQYAEDVRVEREGL